MPRVLIAAVTCLLPVVGVPVSGESVVQSDAAKRIAPTDPPLKITINPEARVSVTLAGPLPRPVPCGAPADLAVSIVNQGFVTSRLEAQFVGETPAGATLEFHPEPLRGLPEERRHLQIVLTKRGLTDLTIAFRAHHGSSDLGGRDRVHFLMLCPIEGGRRAQ